MAFEERGFVESRWDEAEPSGRPRKRLYRLTKAGIELLKEYQEHFGPEVSLGFFATANKELHDAINQVWGGIFQVSVRRERERQASVRAPSRANSQSK